MRYKNIKKKHIKPTNAVALSMLIGYGDSQTGK